MWQFSSLQSLSCVWLFVTPWTVARQAPRPSPTPGVYSNSCPLSWWCHPTISSSVIPFSCPQSFPASGSFLMSLFFTKGGKSLRASASASVLSINIQDLLSLGLTGLFPCSPRDSQESSPASQFKSINSSALSFLHSNNFRASQNKVCHCFPIYLPWSDGTRCHDLHFSR